jgi:hypothetical protein
MHGPPRDVNLLTLRIADGRTHGDRRAGRVAFGRDGRPAPSHQPGGILRPAGLAHRPRAASAPIPAAGAGARAVAGRSPLPRAGAGRRDPARDPRPGTGRSRHRHGRRGPPRELFQPLRHRPGGSRRRQPGHGARPQRTSEPGATGDRADRPQAPGPGARRGVPACQHEPDDQDHRPRAVHDVPAGAERLLRRGRGAGPRLCRRRPRRDRRPLRRGCGHRPDRRALHAGAAGEGAPVRASRAPAGARRHQGHDRRAHASATPPSSTTGRPPIRSCRSSPPPRATRSRSRPASPASTPPSWRRCRARRSFSA